MWYYITLFFTIFVSCNSSLTDLGGFKPVIDSSTGEITGYTTTIGGADTVFPFKGDVPSYIDCTLYTGNNNAASRTTFNNSSGFIKGVTILSRSCQRININSQSGNAALNQRYNVSTQPSFYIYMHTASSDYGSGTATYRLHFDWLSLIIYKNHITQINALFFTLISSLSIFNYNIIFCF